LTSISRQAIFSGKTPMFAVYPIGWTVFLRLIGVNVLVCRPARGGAKPDRPYSSGGAGRVLRSPLDFV
jgi:hypothetical protein